MITRVSRLARHGRADAFSTMLKSTPTVVVPRLLSFSTRSGTGSQTKKPNLISREEGVHQTMQLSKAWRNKPLFRRQGDVRFKTGLEAANLLVAEANRRDSHEKPFIDSITSTLQCLAPVFDRNPRYAFLAKQLQEPERFIQFRVAWIDDTGVVRMNRGYRIQYSSSMGPYEGSLHFGHHVNSGVMKSLGFNAVFSNAVAGFHMGAAVGGADINPFDKSEAEIQRFCQSYMTELFKYIGPDVDEPSMGMGVGQAEVGYLFGQYKRINTKAGSGGKQFLYGGNAAQHVNVSETSAIVDRSKIRLF
jgi:glutamate dehydrogenase (NADP+)